MCPLLNATVITQWREKWPQGYNWSQLKRCLISGQRTTCKVHSERCSWAEREWMKYSLRSTVRHQGPESSSWTPKFSDSIQALEIVHAINTNFHHIEDSEKVGLIATGVPTYARQLLLEPIESFVPSLVIFLLQGAWPVQKKQSLCTLPIVSSRLVRFLPISSYSSKELEKE